MDNSSPPRPGRGPRPSPSPDLPVEDEAHSTAPPGHIEPDSSTDDADYAASTTSSFITSLSSEIRRGVEENGRIYAAYGIHKSWVPVDDREVKLLPRPPAPPAPIRAPTPKAKHSWCGAAQA